MIEDEGYTGQIHRRFDDGAGLTAAGPPRADGVIDGVVLNEAYCAGVDCPCREINVRARQIELPPGRVWRLVDDAKVEAKIDLDSGEISPSPDATLDVRGGELLALLRRVIGSKELDLLRERWKRVKGQQDPDEWRSVDWSKLDLGSLVPYCELFPSSWDLAAISDGHRYWVVDSWCLGRKCPCTEGSVEFMAEESGRSVGALRVRAEDWRVMEDLAGGEARALWAVLSADQDASTKLRERRKQMRRVARALPKFFGSSSAPLENKVPVRRNESSAPLEKKVRVGRNEPCPCASGKKYKRCCGR